MCHILREILNDDDDTNTNTNINNSYSICCHIIYSLDLWEKNENLNKKYNIG